MTMILLYADVCLLKDVTVYQLSVMFNGCIDLILHVVGVTKEYI